MMISNLDLLRSRLLKQTMQYSLFDRLFRSRSLRVLTLLTLALSIYFAASLYFPLWILVIGPIVWGVPHLISSLRYNALLGSHISAGKKLFYLQSLFWLFIFSYRLSIDYFHMDLPLSQETFLMESLVLMASFGVQVLMVKKPTWSQALSFIIFSLFVVVTHYYPIQTALTLLIGHNYIPLWTWYKSCQDQKDTRVFFIGASLYIILSVLIMSGLQNAIYEWLPPQTEIPLFDWHFMSVVEPFGASLQDSNFWFRIVSLYAFSQSIHYFLWMKAIPENYQSQQFPPSFRWSFHKLSSDFGSSSIWLLLIVVMMGAGYWLFFKYQSARAIYFAISSYHGFMELSCLPFLKSNRLSE